MIDRHVVIFARRPRLGVGKRRLARDIGNIEALRFARRSLAQLVRTLGGDPRWTLWIAATPDRPTAWAGPRRVVAQGSGSLGDRLERVVRRLPPGPVVILGSDLPAVSCGDVAAAFAALGGRACVLGPASDGGYWLVGLRRRPRLVLPFRGVRWSSADALRDTIANLGRGRHALLDEREDIDDGAALARLVSRRRTCAGTSRRASRPAPGPTPTDR